MDHPEIGEQYPTLDLVYGIDPALESMTHHEVLEVGTLGKKLVEGLYEPQQDYTDKELQRILYDRAPRYMRTNHRMVIKGRTCHRWLCGIAHRYPVYHP